MSVKVQDTEKGTELNATVADALLKAINRQTDMYERVMGGAPVGAAVNSPRMGGPLQTKELHTKAPANAMSAARLHGLGGLFAGPGLDRTVISAHIRPTGIGSILPLLANNDEDPRFSNITGFTATTGTQPTDICDDAPSGYMKGCDLTALYAPARMDTNTIDFGQVMKKVNRGDFTDLQLKGQLLGLTDLVPSSLNQEDVLNVVSKAEMVIAGINIERLLSQWIWQGTVAAGQFPGLDVQIVTGQTDASTGAVCPALDSDVKDFAYNDVSAGNPDIVNWFTMMAYYLQHIADRTGLSPVRWAIAMRPELWYVLSEIWPCRYLTNRCANSAGTNVNVMNDDANMVLRDRMRRDMILPINGIDFPVVIDDGIAEEDDGDSESIDPGEFASSVYFVPLSITGNFNVTYRQHVDYGAGGGDLALMNGLQEFWTDAGVYSWALEQVKWCYKFALRTEQRVVLRTPQLAGKIQNIKYSILQHMRSPYPDDGYFADGGVSLRTSGTRYAVWMPGGGAAV